MAAASVPTPAPAASPWLFGRGLDLLLGAGLAYVASVPLLVWLSARTAQTAWPADWTVFLAFAFSAPHYGATLVRVYERRADRRRYALFAVHLTLLMVAAFAGGLVSVAFGSLLLTLYVTWSPWHFSGQNYGISLMFLRRAGVAVEPATKRLLYASFVLSALLAIVSVHGALSQLVFAQGTADGSNSYRILRLGIPHAVTVVLGPALGVAWLACLGATALRLLREASARTLVPVAALALTQSLWFTVPALGAATGTWNPANLAFAAIWISTAHSIQYLWVTTFYAGRAAPAVGALSFLGKALLAGALITTAPKLLFVPGLLGPHFAYSAGVPVLLFAVVNIHHFFLDGAVWKLRDGRVARALLRSGGEAVAEEGEARRGIPLAPLLWAAGAACLLVIPFVVLERRIAASPTTETVQVARAVRTLAWLGRDTPDGWLNLAARHEAGGRPARALMAYRGLLDVLRRSGQLPSVELATHVAHQLLALRPGDPAAAEEALRLSRWASQVAPADARARAVHARARAAAGS